VERGNFLSDGEHSQSMLNMDSLFDFNIQLAIGDHVVSEEEWNVILQGTDNLVKIYKNPAKPSGQQYDLV
jgi:hypothetical protein